MPQVTVDYDGREWLFDMDKVSMQQAITIQLAWGFTLEDYQEALEKADARALQCLYWLMLQQNGIERVLKDLDADLVELTTAWKVAVEAEQARQAAEQAEAVELGPTQLAAAPSPARRSRPATTLSASAAGGGSATA